MEDSMTQIYGTTGKPLMAVGGEHSWKQFRKGSVVCSLQWAGKSHEDIEPSMVLFPNVSNTRGGVFVLCLSSLFKYVEKTGYATLNLKTNGWKDIARQLDLDPTSRSVCADICGLIEDAAPELVWMPPAPPVVEAAQAPEKVGELTISERGGKVLHEVQV
jgi:hypothetical protein